MSCARELAAVPVCAFSHFGDKEEKISHNKAMQNYVCPKVAVYTQVVNPELQPYCYPMLTYNGPSNLIFDIESLPCSL